MNYLAEIKAFYDRLELSPQPNTVIALWHALMSIANKAGWPDTFTVAQSVLGLRSGLNASALKRARNKLATDGFIEWKQRGGNLSAQYHINSLVVQNQCKNEPQNEPQCEPQIAPQYEPQSEPINKTKTKTKTNSPPISPVTRFAEFMSAYPKKTKNLQAVEVAYCKLLSDDAHLTESDLIIAAENYADACMILRTEERFIKSPQNFLRDGYLVDYLDGNYVKPKPPVGKNNQFQDFSSTSYEDISELEKKLLSK